MNKREYNRAWRKKQPAGWKSWDGMKDRCLNSRSKDYRNYGARGITIHPRWLDFNNFIADMGPRPIGTSIERKDNSRGYEPGNCIWATPHQQHNNTRANRFVEYQGRRMTIAQWAHELGWSRQALRYRLNAGWNISDALQVGLDHANCKRNLHSQTGGRHGSQDYQSIPTNSD